MVLPSDDHNRLFGALASRERRCRLAETALEEAKAARLVVVGLRQGLERRAADIEDRLLNLTHQNRPARLRLYRELAGITASLERLEELEADFAGQEAVARAAAVAARTHTRSEPPACGK